MRTKAMVTAALISGALTMSVTAADKPKDVKPGVRDCLFSTTVRDWRPLDSEHLVIWGPSLNDAYLVTLMGPVSDLPFSENVAFIDDDHDGMICGDGGDKVAVPGPAQGLPTFIKSMQHLDEASLQALSEQYKVKLTRKKKTDAPPPTASSAK